MVDLSYDKIFGYDRSFAFAKDFIKKSIIFRVGKVFGVQTCLLHYGGSPYHGWVYENISEMHSPGNRFLFNRRFILIGFAGRKVFKKAPTSNEVDIRVLIQESNLSREPIFGTNVTAIKPCDIA